jgi:hypothetical protein
MDAPPETTAVWIAESPPTDNAKIALERWARGRGARITSPQAAREIAVDRSVSSLIESELAKAKDAILAGDAERAESGTVIALEWPERAEKWLARLWPDVVRLTIRTEGPVRHVELS